MSVAQARPAPASTVVHQENRADLDSCTAQWITTRPIRINSAVCPCQSVITAGTATPALISPTPLPGERRGGGERPNTGMCSNQRAALSQPHTTQDEASPSRAQN